MPTLKAILEEVGGLGPGYLISEHGAYWLVSDLLERLEQDTPERLTYLVSWVVPDDTEEGAIYASNAAEDILSAVPLYRIHRLNQSSPLDSSAAREQYQIQSFEIAANSSVYLHILDNLLFP